MPNLVALIQTVWASVGDSKKNWGRWAPAIYDRGRATPKTLLFHACYQAEFVRSRSVSNDYGYRPMDILRKFLTFIVLPYKVTRVSRSSDTDQSATYDFLLVFRSSAPISYRFRDKGR